MIKQYYKIQVLSAIRFIKSLGLFYACISVILFLFAGAVMVMKADNNISVMINLMVILLLHNYRKDHEFLQVHIKRPFVIYFIDYLVISLPTILALVNSNDYWLLIGYILVGLIIIVRLSRQALPQLTNISLQYISSLHPIIKSNLRSYYFVMVIGVIIFYASVFIHTEIPFYIYLYQGLLVYICLLSTDSEGSWYMKCFNSASHIVYLKLKSISINYLKVVVVGVVPFIVHGETLIEFVLISVAGFFAIISNLLLSIIFKSNKIFLGISQLINVVFIVVCIQQSSVIFLQVILLFFTILFSIKILQNRYTW